MEAIEKWRSMNNGAYASQINRLVIENTNRRHIKQNIKPEYHKTLIDCALTALLEAQYNWFNYWTDDSDTPEDKQHSIFFGKFWELLLAVKNRDLIAVWPSIYSKTPEPEYDFILTSGKKVDVKTAKRSALEHKTKYPNVEVWYPDNSQDENSKINIL